MLTRLRSRLSFANVVSLIALFVALGGSSYAAIGLKRNSVASSHIRNGAVKRADLAKNAVNSSKVGNGSLRAEDFAVGQLPTLCSGLARYRGAGECLARAPGRM